MAKRKPDGDPRVPRPRFGIDGTMDSRPPERPAKPDKPPAKPPDKDGS